MDDLSTSEKTTDGTARRTSSALALAWWVIAGLSVGVLAKLADLRGSWFGDAATYPALWVLPIAVAARTSPGRVQTALRSAGFFVPMIVAYYAWAQSVLGYGYTSALIFWLVIAAGAVPLIAALVHWGRGGPDVVAGVTAAGLACLAFRGGAVHRLWLAAEGHIPGASTRPVQAALELLVAAGIVLWLPRTRRGRLWAALALVPMTWGVAHVIAALSLPL